MPLLRPIPKRDRKLVIAITAELDERLRSTQRRCRERGMELPFQDAVEAFLARLVADADAELSGAAPPRRGRGGKPAAGAGNGVGKTLSTASDPTAAGG